MIENKIVVRNLRKKFKRGFSKSLHTFGRIKSFFSGGKREVVDVLHGVSFDSNSGVLGIIGKNGSGKSTLLRILAGIYCHEEGFVKTSGKVVPLIGLGRGMHERLSMKDNVFLAGSLFGMSEAEIKNDFDSIVEFAELEDFVDVKLYQFSEGMKQRLAFSIAIHCEPEVLLLDEVFEVGDESFKKKSVDKIKELVKKGVNVVLVTHELFMVEKYCDRVIWLDKGKIKMDGKPKEVVKDYRKFAG